MGGQGLSNKMFLLCSEYQKVQCDGCSLRVLHCALTLIDREEEANCLQPMRLYINTAMLSDWLDVCLIVVLVVVCVWVTESVMTPSDGLVRS